MNALFFIIGLALCIRFTHKMTALLWLWWRKEYRLDRMAIHLKTAQGKSLYSSKSDWALAFFALLYFIPAIRNLSYIGIGILALLFAFQYLRTVRTSWYIPPSSPKVLVSYVIFGSILLFTLFLQVPFLLAIALLDVLMFPISLPIIYLLNLPTWLYHSMVIHSAVSLLRKHQPMKVIGITGSYGKTSVKDYLHTILSSKYRTLKTEYSKNSPIGIAEVIRGKLTPETEVFVVEMGAYKRGEIRTMASMVLPEIGIVTAVNPQHQDLFKTIETTALAKFELLEGLTGMKIAIVNWDNPYTKEMGEKAKKMGCTVWWWSTKETKDHDHLYRATSIKPSMNAISFDVQMGKEKVHVTAPVVGVHQSGNILAAMIAARCAGLTLAESAKAATLLQPAEKVMQVEPGVSGSIFVNDTFNNNPDAAKAAISFLGQNKGKKYVVFQPMIELGSYAESAHEEVGEVAGDTCDAIILTNTNFSEAFKKGVAKHSSSVPVMISTATEAAAYLLKTLKKGDMVLFKGKDAEHTLSLLRKEQS